MQQYYCSNSTNPNYNPPFPENDININNSSISSKLQDPVSNNFLFSFPNSPHIHLEYEDAYNQFLQLFDYQKSMENQTPVTHDNNPNQETAAGGGYQPPPPARKRCCKKDRHSKINTARGPRDRRMRLSLEVARKFFDLQDLLGYDKASRTVDWLIKNSTAAIRRLERSKGGGGGSCSFNMAATAHSGSASASSDGCEAVSSPNHSTTTTAAAAGAVAVEPQQQLRAKPKRRKTIRAARAPVERESRKRARERARERTSQKRRLLLDGSTNQPKIFSKNSRESPMEASTEFDDLNSETQVNPLLYSATWNPSAMYQSNAGIVSHHIADQEFDCGQAWEAAYNSTAFN